MADRPPPGRYSVVERGGRLVVLDRETGQTPLSAAERRDLHDRSLGMEPIRPVKASAVPDMSAAARAESGLSARPAPAQHATPAATDSKARVAAAIAERGKRPWTRQPADRPALKSNAKPGQTAGRPAPQAGGRKTIVTGKWWDAKGPRTIELGPQGQRELTGGFMTLFFVAVAASIVALFIQPVIFFAAAFLVFRFGGQILGPIGAGIIDKALAQKG